MAQPSVDNATPFAAELLFVADEEGCPLVVPVVKGTWTIEARGLALAADQVPVNVRGEAVAEGRPGTSYRYEPECAFIKPATDVVLIGSACAPRVGITEMLVAFQAGPLKKGVRVIGDRAFYKAPGGVGMTRPLPFERIPLVWERAFGGTDTSHPDKAKHEVDRRNPAGVGFRGKGSRFEDGLRCPNVEDPARPLRAFGDLPPPAGFGFTSPDWQPRALHGGTCDEAWLRERAPLLPRDFDRRYFNAASPGLVAPGYLRGDEAVAATGVTKSGGVSFRLPGVAPPRVTLHHAGRADASAETRLDTVIVDTDAGKLFLLWRTQLRVREYGSVRTLQISPGAGPRPLRA